MQFLANETCSRVFKSQSQLFLRFLCDVPDEGTNLEVFQADTTVAFNFVLSSIHSTVGSA